MLSIAAHVQNVLAEESRNRTVGELLVLMTRVPVHPELRRAARELGAVCLGGQEGRIATRHGNPRPIEDDVLWIVLSGGETLITCWHAGLTADEHEIYLRLRTDGMAPEQAAECAQSLVETR